MTLTEDQQEHLLYHLGYNYRNLSHLSPLLRDSLSRNLTHFRYTRLTTALGNLDAYEALQSELLGEIEALELDDLKIDLYRKLVAIRYLAAEEVDTIAQLLAIPLVHNRYRHSVDSQPVYY